MQTRLATPPLNRGSASPYCPAAGHLRCVKRAVEASVRGDNLEAGYWLNLAAAARRRASTASPRQETMLSRVIRACSLFLLRGERVV
jgi:hypothetical protein